MRVRAVAMTIAGMAALSGCGNDVPLVYLGGPNVHPVAVIAGDAAFVPLDSATFDGTGSYDPDGVVSAYHWEIVERPEGSDPTNDAVPVDGGRFATFFVDLAGDYRIRLTVRDDRNATASEEFTFSAIPWQALHVQLTWNKPHADVDLHLVMDSAGGSFYQPPYDCYYQNKNPNWGAFASTLDDPSLDRDDIDGYGPENINIGAPAPGKYHLYVHYYQEDGDGATEARLRIYFSGALVWEGTKLLSNTNKTWNVVTIDYPGEAITTLGNVFDYTP